MRIREGKPAVILAENDGEGVAICGLLTALARERPERFPDGIVVIRKAAAWGSELTLDADEEQTLDGCDPVVLVEQPAPDLEARLKARGHDVVRIDHHLYSRPTGGIVDARNAYSAIEQIAALFECGPLSPRDALISANDRGHVPTLAAEALRQQEAAIRPAFEAATAALLAALPETVPRGDVSAINGLVRDNAADALSAPGLAQPIANFTAAVEAVRDEEVAISFALAAGGTAADRDIAAARRLVDEARRYLEDERDEGLARVLRTDRGVGTDPELHLVLAPKRFGLALGDAIYREFWERGLSEHALPDWRDLYRPGDGADDLWHRKPADKVAAAWFARFRSLVTGRIDYMILLHEDDAHSPDAVVQVEFSGAGRHAAMVAEIVTGAGRPGSPFARLSLFAAGSEGAYLGAKDLLGSESGTLGALADTILDDALTGQRPVTTWRVHFLQPMVFRPPKGGQRVDLTNGDVRAAQIDPQERAYFLPHIRRFLTPSESHGDEPLADHHLRSYDIVISGLSLRVTVPSSGWRTDLPISDLRVHTFYNDTLILEWVVNAPAESLWRKAEGRAKSLGHGTFWRRLLASRPCDSGLPATVATVMDAVAKARFCASTYIDPQGGGWIDIQLMEGGQSRGTLLRYAQEVTDSENGGNGCASRERSDRTNCIAGWFRGLTEIALPPLGLKPADGIEPAAGEAILMSDERARVLASMVLSGSAPATKPGREVLDLLFSRWLSVDGWGDSHFYGKDFALKEMRDGRYDRYCEWGSLYGASSHSFVFMGFGDAFAKDRFTLDIVHRNHMATIYRRQYLLILFYELALNRFALEAAFSARLDDEERARRYQCLQREFLVFTNGSWFPQVTTQIQGRELMKIMRFHSTIDDDFEIVQAEIERMDSYLETERARESAHHEERSRIFQDAITLLAIPAAVFVALIGFSEDGIRAVFPYYDALDAIYDSLNGFLLRTFGEVFRFSGRIIFYLSMNALVTMLVVVGLRYWFAKNNQRSRSRNRV